MAVPTKVRKIFKKDRDVDEDELVEEDVLIEEADDEYVLLKAFTSKNPEVAFSYAINRIDELKVEVASLIKDRDSLEEVNAAMQDDLEEAFRFKNQVEDLQDELLSKEQELSDKSVEIDTLVRKSAKFSVDIDALKERLRKKDNQVQSYLKQMEALKQDSRVIELEKSRRLNEGKIADLEEEAKALRIQVEEQKTALTVQGEELEQYKQSAASMDAELNTLKASWWGANTQIKDIKRQLDEKESVLESKEEMIKNLMLKSNEIKAELDTLKTTSADRERDISDYEKRIEEADKKRDELLKQAEKKESQIRELEEKVAEALDKGPKLLEAEKRIEELLPVEDEVKKLRVQIEEQKDALSVVTSEADQYKQMAASMDGELNSLKMSWWETNKQVKGLKEEIELKASIIDAKDNTIKELIAKSRGVTEELDMLKKQMTESAMMSGGTAATTTAQPAEEALAPSTPAAEHTPAPEEPAQPVKEPTLPPAETPAPVEKPASPFEEPAPKAEETAPEPPAPAAEKPAEPTPSPKVSPNASKIKLLEIEKRSVLKMLDNPKIRGTSFEANYQKKLDEIHSKIEELLGQE